MNVTYLVEILFTLVPSWQTRREMGHHLGFVDLLQDDFIEKQVLLIYYAMILLKKTQVAIFISLCMSLFASCCAHCFVEYFCLAFACPDSDLWG